jgi:hypothetical protein
MIGRIDHLIVHLAIHLLVPIDTIHTIGGIYHGHPISAHPDQKGMITVLTGEGNKIEDTNDHAYFICDDKCPVYQSFGIGYQCRT